ncbi:MAG TPA: roadblock/LC7 domain-containing protein [Candidatus Baltobacteraceae bacterium]|jgi:predicted regulator of Ras-like GTPase activity (Roadblock/LC7/MglB family)|nr:roadblock/LC7 domain-containing protein [Candidatus Baltobacteraceae bacterium]
MPGLPPLIQEDVDTLEAALDQLLLKSEATAALVIDKGGPLVSQRGTVDRFDTTTISALAAGSFCATQAIAELLGEPNFASIYQQGKHHSLLFCNIDENLLLIVIFKATQSVGVVKYYAVETIRRIMEQLQRAQERAPDTSVDLVSMNVLDVSSIFRKQP